MPNPDRFEKRYQTDDAPWEIGRADSNLVRTVEEWPVEPCRALDIGCGLGANVLWLARQGFTVTGVDASPTALARARENAAASAAHAVECAFVQADFLLEPIAGGPFDFLVDRGCFHSFDTLEERVTFSERAAASLRPGGLWLSISGSADDAPRDHGPPRRTAREIVVAVEPRFEILSLRVGRFDSDREKPPRAWVTLLRSRS